jgi:hypothetical protein
MRRLVESWIEAERSRGSNLTDAIRLLNEALDSKVTHSRLSEWKRGRYVPKQEALSFILLRTLPWAIEQAGIRASEEQIRALEQLVWIGDDDGYELL